MKQKEEGITLSQGSYVLKILDKGGMLDCNPCQVPMDPKVKLSKESNTPPVGATEYRSMVGSLRYLVNIRPDLAFSVEYVSRFMEMPHEEHLVAVKHILRYLAGTWNWGLFYPRKRGEKIELRGFSDSDLAEDLNSRTSTSEVLFLLGDSPVS